MKKRNLLKLLVTMAAVYLSGCATEKTKEVYLPPSFMDAELLSGGYFSPEDHNPTPVIVNITGPASLPNDLQSSVLVGCIALAEGYGHLPSERAQLRLVTVSCVDNNGKTRIDQPVKGFLQGSDGIAGLPGKLVHLQGPTPFVEVPVSTKATLVITQGVMLQEK